MRFELTTSGFEVHHSIQPSYRCLLLLYYIIIYIKQKKITINCYLLLMERVARIELAYSAWKADVLPMNYTRIWSERRDSNPQHPPWQGGALPLSHSRIFKLVQMKGVEPPHRKILDPKSSASANSATSANW